MEKTTYMALNRRSFMTGVGGLTFGIALTHTSLAKSGLASAATASDANLSHWVTLSSDGTIQIMTAVTEMGQGSRTHVPVILADYMDADWSKVKLVNAPPDDKLYGNPGMGGFMYTAGSRGVKGYYAPMQTLGAQARHVLMASVAKKWNVPVSELTTEPSIVVHAKSGRRISYGDIVAFLELPEKAPEITPDMLKKPEDLRYIGKHVMREDVPAKSRGLAQYAIDVHVPGMVYGAMLRQPVEGAAPLAVDESEARRINGVIDIVKTPYGVGVVADKPWTAFAARDALKVTWDMTVKAWKHDSDAALETYRAEARDLAKAGIAGGEKVGDAKAALEKAAKVVEAEYFTDLVYHAQMEPLNSVAHVTEGGKKAEIWLGTQSQTIAVESACKTLGTTPENIVLHDMILGGGFGRRMHREQEFLTDALLLSKAVAKPVKVIWTREEDLKGGHFRPMTAQYLRAGLDAKGSIVAWHHRVVGDLCFVYVDPWRAGRANGRDGMVAGGAEAVVYAFPDRLSEVTIFDNGVRTSPLRGIGSGPNKFAIASFIDEIARAQGIDPVAYHRTMLSHNTRALRVIEKTAEISAWGKNEPGRFKGFSFLDYNGTYVSAVADISIDAASGKIRVHRFWLSVDPGLAVQPENIRAQMEGGIIYALGGALSERITIKDGVVTESNFGDYTLPRARELPEIEIAIVSSPDLPPSGVGEEAVVTVGPAIASAFAAATGKRLRHLPMTPDRVKAVLSA